MNTDTQLQTKKINPIVANLAFIRRTVFAKKSIWICFGLFSFFSFLIGLLPTVFYLVLDDIEVISFIAPATIMQSSSIICTSGLIGVIVFVTIFKDGETDGTELIIVSKPITRGQILLSRFIFVTLVAICMSLIYVVIIAISFGINNLSSDKKAAEEFFYKLNPSRGPALFGGTFGGVILSFMTFGLIGGAISIKGGSKVTRTISMLALFGSAGVAGITTNLENLELFKHPVYTASNDSVTAYFQKWKNKKFSDINKELKQLYKFDFFRSEFNDEKITSIRAKVIGEYDSLQIDKKTNTIKINYKLNLLIGPYETRIEEYIVQDKIAEVMNILNQIAIKETPKSFGASWTTAIDYLNPISALSNMIIDTSLINLGSFLPTNLIIHNLTIVEESKDDYHSDEKDYYIAIKGKDVSIADPVWATTLLWTSVMVGLGVITALGYLRKDFK